MVFQNGYKNNTNYAQHADFNLNDVSELIEGLPEILVSENDSAYYVRAFVPGLSLDEIQVRYKESMLELEIKLTSPSGRYLYQERAVGNFLRKIEFSSYIDGESIHSELKNGLLYIALPKEKSEKIEIVPEEKRKKSINFVTILDANQKEKNNADEPKR